MEESRHVHGSSKTETWHSWASFRLHGLATSVCLKHWLMVDAVGVQSFLGMTRTCFHVFTGAASLWNCQLRCVALIPIHVVQSLCGGPATHMY